MRTIKLRARNIAANSWMDSSSILGSLTNANYFEGLKGNKDITVIQSDESTHPSIVIQLFTGLKDVNGKDIYEGDLITTNYRLTSVEIIVFKEGCFWGEMFPLSSYCNPPDFTCEVIGNIFDNPELIK